jgi:hypothetical protein
MFRSTTTGAAALLSITWCLLAGSVQAAVVHNLHFTGGNGSTSVDQYPGIAGTRWLEGWVETGSITASVVDNDVLVAGGGNYLSISNLTGGEGVTRRLLAPTDHAYRLELDLRVDSLPDEASLTLSTGSNRLINTNASNYIQTKASVGGEWFFSGGGGSVFSGIDLVEGTVYHFDFLLDPVDKQYMATVSDGLSSYTSDWILFRNQNAPVSMPFFELGSQATTVSDDTLAYSLDNIRLVPEPGSAALCLLGLLGLVTCRPAGRRRRPAA